MIQRAKLRLVMNHPYFAMTALKMEYVANDAVGTMSINSKAITYSPSWVNSLKIEEVEAVIAHEVLHYLLLHHVRGIGKDGDTWNEACDYVVNAELRKYFKLPAGNLYDPKFEGMDADTVYALLETDKANKQKQQQNQQDDGNDDGDDDSGSNQPQQGSDNQGSSDKNQPQNWGKVEAVKEDEAAEAEAEAKEAASEALNAAKQAGKGFSPALTAMLHEIIEPKKDWRALLNKFMAEIAKNDYTWAKPNRRYTSMGLYLPSLESLEIGKIVFAIDTSISVNENLLANFGGELKGIASMFSIPITVIHCDDDIRKVEELDIDTDLTPVGRGLTSFEPVFKYVNENLPDTKALIYFTDGFCHDKIEAPDYEVLWVIYGNPNFRWNFGEIINII